MQVSIVVPLYNESKVFPTLVSRLKDLMDASELSIEVVMVDDGSKDNTPEQMRQIALLDPRFTAVFLSRNYGHQLALSAGLEASNGSEAVFVIDGDLQDPPELLPDFYAKMKEGYDVVYAVRKNRKEGMFKKMAYHWFYRTQKKLVPIDIPLDSGDFSLISRKVVDIIARMPEQSRYIRGLRAWIGLRQVGIEYEREERAAGTSKYSWKMLIRLALNGIFNFTEIPIRFITKLGIYTIVGAVLYLAYTLVMKYVFGSVPPGFTALLFVVILFSGVQLISIGIIGEYVQRIFFETKGRPLFIVKNKIVNGNIIDG